MAAFDTTKAKMTTDTKVDNKLTGEADCEYTTDVDGDGTEDDPGYACDSFVGGYTNAVSNMKGICVES